MIFIIIAVIVVAFIAIVLIRTAMFRPYEAVAPDTSELTVDGDRAVSHLQRMIRIKTVSNRDDSLVDWSKFEEFRNALGEMYPAVSAKCTVELIGKSGVLYTLKGKSSKEPSVFMAHYDVVPANEEAWSKPAFDAIIEDGVMWGRGTLDTKTTLLGVMEAAEDLIRDGFVPENDMYFAFSGDEEIMGTSAGSIVAELEKRGVVPALVLDEGGAVVEDVFPGVHGRCALVGTGEKGLMDLDMIIDGAGGHASAPPPHTSVGRLAKAVSAIEDHPFKAKLSKPAAGMYDTLGRHSTFAYRMIFANQWCFFQLLNSMCKKKGGEMNAMMRTTCAFTMMDGSLAHNVLPPHARIGANLRLAEGDTTESAVAYLKKLANDDGIEFKVAYGMDPQRSSDTSCESWKKVQSAIAGTWKGCLVSPYLMVACSDSRHYCRITDKVYRFSAMELSTEERRLIHGNDERITLEKISSAVEFYKRIMKMY